MNLKQILVIVAMSLIIGGVIVIIGGHGVVGGAVAAGAGFLVGMWTREMK